MRVVDIIYNNMRSTTNAGLVCNEIKMSKTLLNQIKMELEKELLFMQEEIPYKQTLFGMEILLDESMPLDTFNIKWRVRQ